MPETRAAAEAVEPYKLSEIFSIIPEYDGNQIFLNTFITSCTTAFSMAVGNQTPLLVLHIKNKLRGRAAELVNSRNPVSWDDIRNLLETHFGDSRDLSSLIQDLQRLRQTPNESPLTFAARLQTHEAKMHAAINKQNLTAKEKTAQISLIDSMVLNSLLTGVEPRIGQILRASDPDDIITAISRIKRELQLNHFESQKLFGTRNIPTQVRKPPTPTKQCSFCRRPGHSFNECITRQRQASQTSQQNYNFRPNPSTQTQFNRFPQQSSSQQQNRPSTSGTSAPFNNNSNRPPNFFKQQRAHHLNQSIHHNHFDYDDYDSGYETGHLQQNAYYDEYSDENAQYNSNPSLFPNQDYFNNHDQSNLLENSANFHTPPPQMAPPDTQIEALQTQFQIMNLEPNFNPNLNFPEQNFI